MGLGPSPIGPISHYRTGLRPPSAAFEDNLMDGFDSSSQQAYGEVGTLANG